MKLRWGFLGAGKVARDHANVMLFLQDTNVVAAVADVQLELAKEFAQMFDVETFCTPEELVARDDVDIVYVATPHKYHYQCTVMALEAGKHVLVEKPFGVNAKQAQSMIDLARDKKLFLAENMWSACFPAFVELRQEVERGRIGDIKIMDLYYYVDDYGPSSWRVVAPNPYGGGTLERAMYMTMFATAFLDSYPEEISACGIVNEHGADDTFMASLRYKNGTMVSIRNSISTDGGLGVNIYGTKGRVADVDVFHQMQRYRIVDKVVDKTIVPKKPRYPYNYDANTREHFKHLVEAVRESIQQG